jgi:hypothetical protein
VSVEVLACQTVKDEMERLVGAGIKREYLPYGLHRTPEMLRDELKERLRSIDAATVILGYGLCSNGVVGLCPKKGQRLVIPRVHDCISLLMGSRQAYYAEFGKCPGTVYLSKGWIDSKGDPLSEYQSYCKKHGEDTARWVIEEEYKNYTRLCLIDTGVGDLEEYRKYSRDVAAFLNLPLEEIKGLDTYFKRLLDDSLWDHDFLVIEHPGEVRQAMFL